ncbi:hypothetical protein Tco_1132797 [Tanacetum coccineum]|uniref:Uncharacterized protein n=1 Tax=Tanacetum coccineum TaxID=301880 RepID=A0ABQ5JE06_9ASTR
MTDIWRRRGCDSAGPVCEWGRRFGVMMVRRAGSLGSDFEYPSQLQQSGGVLSERIEEKACCAVGDGVSMGTEEIQGWVCSGRGGLRIDGVDIELSSVALAVLTTQPACHPSLASCLSSHGESILSVHDAYGQSFEALSSQPAASGSESHIPGVVSE